MNKIIFLLFFVLFAFPSMLKAGLTDDEAEVDAPKTAVITMVGPQGSGKSTCARALTLILEHLGHKTCWLNQDELGDRGAYLAAMAANMGRASFIILDKLNHTQALRSDGFQIQGPPHKDNMIIHFDHRQVPTNLFVRRFQERGDRHYADLAGLDRLPAYFLKGFQDFSANEKDNNTIVGLDPRQPMEAHVRSVLMSLFNDHQKKLLDGLEYLPQAILDAKSYEGSLQYLHKAGPFKKRPSMAVIHCSSFVSHLVQRLPDYLLHLGAQEFLRPYQGFLRSFDRTQGTDIRWMIDHGQGQLHALQARELWIYPNSMVAILKSEEEGTPLFEGIPHLIIAKNPDTKVKDVVALLGTKKPRHKLQINPPIDILEPVTFLA